MRWSTDPNTTPRRFLIASCTASVLALGLVVAPTSSADPEPTLAEVRERVDELNQQVVEATERYNAAFDERSEVQRRLDRATSQVEDQQALVSLTRERVGSFASASYRSGGMGISMQTVFASDPDAALDRAATVTAYQRQQQSVLLSLRNDQRALSDAEGAVADDVAVLDAIAADRERTQQEIEGLLAESEELLAGLEEEERQRLEAERIAAEQEAERQRQEAEQERQEAEQERRAAEERASRDEADRGDEDTDQESADQGTDDAGDDTADPEPDSSDDAADDSGEDTGEPADDPAPSSRGQAAVDFAMAQIGDAYSYGASGPNAWDCSGLTSMAWKAAGVSLPRSSGAQAGTGTPVSRSQLQPGDLVFYYSPISHVGIYIGDGKLVHASRPGRPVHVTSVDSMPYSGARRPG